MKLFTLISKIAAHCLIAILCLLLTFTTGQKLALAQSVNTLKFAQDTERSQVREITAQELAQLNDPFFNLVLKEHSNETNLGEIENLLQPNADRRETFVVDERIVDSSRPQTRRTVLTFKGSNDNIVLSNNVMFSTSFSSEEFPENPELLEVWGWDDILGRYNYYSLDRRGNRFSEPRRGTLTWKFRGNSVNADTISVSDRAGTCMRCHVNGAPVFKELFLPWNNWESFVAEETSYLRFPPPVGWPVVNNPRLKDNLESAEVLEAEIISGINQFNDKRIDNLTIEDDGNIEVREAQRLLKPLFITTEFNIISSAQTTRLHPFTSNTVLPTDDYVIPKSFFLNSDLIVGRRQGAEFPGGFGIESAGSFEVKVNPTEYERLVQEARVKLANQQPGDTNFGWLVPEPSFIDSNFVSQLMQKQIVPREFVAAVLAIDLENSILSEDRKRLFDADIIPNEFQVAPVNNLISQTIANLQSLNPAMDSPEDQLLAILQSEDPVAILRERVEEYLNRETTLLNGDDETRFTELTRLYNKAVAKRQAVLADANLGNLDETRGTLLFPVP